HLESVRELEPLGARQGEVARLSGRGRGQRGDQGRALDRAILGLRRVSVRRAAAGSERYGSEGGDADRDGSGCLHWSPSSSESRSTRISMVTWASGRSQVCATRSTSPTVTSCSAEGRAVNRAGCSKWIVS